MNASHANGAHASTHETADLLTTLVKYLVDYPEEAAVEVVEGGQSVIFEITVHREDVRRIIGRKGRTASALRELMYNLGAKAGLRYVLEIVEPPGFMPRARVIRAPE